MLHHASDHVLCQFPAGNSYQFGRVGSRCAYGVTTSKYGWYAMSRDAFLSGVGTFFTSRNVFIVCTPDATAGYGYTHDT